MAAIISLTVVLPLLPATPTTGIAKLRAPAARGACQRGLRVRHDDLRAAARSTGRVDHGAGRARGLRGVDEIIGVEARAAQRDEQLAGLQRARVGATRRV